MKSLYLLLNVFTIIIPLAYSIFEQKFNFIRHAKASFSAISVVALFFLIWDAIFTAQGVWGFNPDYYLGYTLLAMPIEEWLFFICIPYACLFSHEALKYYFPNWGFNINVVKKIAVALAAGSILLATYCFDKSYTSVNFYFLGILLLISVKFQPIELAKYLPSFFIILIPFFIVNGILTGSFIPGEVVWYNNNENLNFRIGTIPIEDAGYAFNMLFSVQILFNYFKK